MALPMKASLLDLLGGGHDDVLEGELDVREFDSDQCQNSWALNLDTHDVGFLLLTGGGAMLAN